jgi:seryl-tRNA synthetase
MLDIRFVRDNRELVEKSAAAKGYQIDVVRLNEVDDNRRKLMAEIETLRAERNQLADEAKGGQPDPAKIEKGKQLKESLGQLENQLSPVSEEFDKLLREIPNIIPDDTPPGGEDNNRQEKTWGDTNPRQAKDHMSWAEERGLLDFERGAKVAGNKFYFTKGSLVELEFAVLQLGLKLAKEQGFTPMLVPHMVSGRIIDGAGFTAKSDEEKQIYKIEDEDLHLIATAEIPMTGYHADETLAEADLPKLYAGYSPAYRLEAGAYGKHSRGLYRVHQFNKLELYVFCKPDQSEEWHQKLLSLEENLCQQLEIPYRVVRIAAGDLGAPAYKKFDVEYWTPVDNSYRELMSVSNVTDYQARRLSIRYKKPDGGSEFLHTLNGTMAAMSRIPIALIENRQDGQGNVSIPPALQPYMSGQTTI